MKGDLILKTVANKRCDSIAAGYRHTVGLKSAGTAAAVGWRGIHKAGNRN